VIRVRGAALPETVVMLGLTLTLIFGVCELGLVGFAQLGDDGAAFVAAHASVVGNDPAAAIASPFPMTAKSSSIAVAPTGPDASDVPVDYQLTNAARHGGVQIVRPTRTQATITQTNVGIGHVIPFVNLGGAAIEPQMLVSNTGFDLAGTPINSAASYSSQTSYFSDDADAPPYYIGLQYFWHCVSVRIGSGCTGWQMDAIGSGAYLDGSNWSQPYDGVGSNATFAALLLHQQTYAKIASALPSNLNGRLQTHLDPANDPCLKTVAGWDIAVPPGYKLGSVSIGTYPLHPLENSYGC